MYDLVGIGFGPSNIALAIALEEQLGRIDMSARTRFLEMQAASYWHPHMMLARAFMQVAFLKDLVTMRDPTSPYTFLNYLKLQGRLDEFVNLRTFYPSRLEFSQYVQWVADQFQDIVSYSTCVTGVTAVRGKSGGAVTSLLVEVDSGEVYETRNLAVASGGKPAIPAVFKTALGPQVFHSQDYLMRLPNPKNLEGAVVAVVGHGQSAAEIVYDVASRCPETEVVPIIRDLAIRPIDSSKFINETFFPRSVDYIYNLPKGNRQKFLQSVRNTVYSVVDPDLINDLYNLIYRAKVAGREQVKFLPYGVIENVDIIDGKAVLDWRNSMTEEAGRLIADYVVLATGFDYASLPENLNPIREFVLQEEGKLQIERDYRLACREDFEPGIYLQGFAEHSHGMAETALSLTAHRTGVIASALCKRLQLEQPDRKEALEALGDTELVDEMVVQAEGI